MNGLRVDQTVAVDAARAILPLLRALRQAKPSPGERLLVMGEDGRAWLLAQLGAATGVRQVIGVVPQRARAQNGPVATRQPVWVESLAAARDALDQTPDQTSNDPIDKADLLLLIGTMHLADALALVRDNGRVWVWDAAGRLDIDLYPHIHRRSLRVYFGDLAGAPSQADGDDLAFIAHLVQTGRLAGVALGTA